jgi:hypothetical protein
MSNNTLLLPEFHTDENHPLVVFFIFFGLFLGCILREVNKSTKIPYTPMLIVFGIIISHKRDSLGTIYIS